MIVGNPLRTYIQKTFCYKRRDMTCSSHPSSRVPITFCNIQCVFVRFVLHRLSPSHALLSKSQWDAKRNIVERYWCKYVMLLASRTVDIMLPMIECHFKHYRLYLVLYVGWRQADRCSCSMLSLVPKSELLWQSTVSNFASEHLRR